MALSNNNSQSNHTMKRNIYAQGLTTEELQQYHANQCMEDVNEWFRLQEFGYILDNDYEDYVNMNMNEIM